MVSNLDPAGFPAKRAVSRCGFQVSALALFLALSPPAHAGQDLVHPFSSNLISTPAVTAAIPGLVKGETLEYDLYWGFIKVGKAFLKAENVVNISSRPAWRLVLEARSNSFIETFYKVEDRHESWMDAADLRSHGYYKKISEGRHFRNEWAVFDWAARKFYGKKINRKGKISDFEGPLEKPVSDMLSAVYRVRGMRLAPGAAIQLDVNTKRNWALTIKAGKREKVETAYGKKNCVVLEPLVGDDGLFVAKSGRRMFIWVTDDALKVPMLLKAEIAIGSLTGKLRKRTIQ
ncbi:MAG: hypothetical protein COT18_07980 [Elusimicrobia bacterium CG08_land_8_20_14_0_20_59_10]|nr:MAG: hypothetical protein COT18_07980 [Elusimicrobia bacterium CG08_land_8_20_14_0_20_59_10]